MSQAYRCHASDDTKNRCCSWFKTCQWAGQVQRQLERLERYLYGLQIFHASREGGLLSCFHVDFFEFSEKLCDILALGNSNVYVFPETVDRLPVGCTPKVGRSDDMHVMANSRPICNQILVEMVRVESDLIGFVLGCVMAGVGRSFGGGLIRLIGRQGVGSGSRIVE